MTPVYWITARRTDRVLYRVDAETPEDAADRVWTEGEVDAEESENLGIDVIEVRDAPEGKEIQLR